MKKFPTPPSNELDLQSALKFSRLAVKMSTLLKEDGIAITFEGLTETLNDYFSLQENDAFTAFEMTKMSNLWFNYMAEVESIIGYHVGQTLMEIEKMNATLVPEDELLIHEKRISELTLKHHSLKLFYKQIRGKKKFFIGAYYHCMKVYHKATDNFIYKQQYN